MTEQVVDRDGLIKVETSTDKMEAYLVIEPPVGNGKWPTVEEAFQALKSENIVFGIDEEAVKEVIKSQKTGPHLVASGQRPVAGKDAEFRFLFSLTPGEHSLTEDEFGRVDYRDLQTVQNVVVGEVLAEKIPATPGEPGVDVFGNSLAPVSGKDKTLRLGKNVVMTNDGLRAVSTINGEPSFSAGKLSVFPIHEVKGDVDFNTGNINFRGSVVVRGNVTAGFKVEADGDITIRGMVEAADLTAGGSITIFGGISGMDKAQINCVGDFSAKYVEHASINCDSNVLIKEAMMYCQVNADGKISVDSGKGLIVGGILRAGEEISAKIIGSKFGTVTEMEVGIRPKMKIEFQDLEDQIKEYKVNLEKAEKAVALLEKSPYLPKDRQEMYQNLVKTTYVLKGQIAEAEARRKELLEEMVVLSKEKARIRARDTIYPGVRITIGKATTIIKDEIKFVTLMYGEGEIQTQPYR